MRTNLVFCAAQLAVILLVTPPAAAKCGPCDSHYDAASGYYSQNQYARAISEYSQVGGNDFCRFLANYYSAASNYSRAYAMQEAATIQSDALDSEAVQLRDSVTDQLRTALSLGSSPEIGRCAGAEERTQAHRVIGQAKYTLALLLERAQRNPREILRLLAAMKRRISRSRARRSSAGEFCAQDFVQTVHSEVAGLKRVALGKMPEENQLR